MRLTTVSSIVYPDANETMKNRIEREWSERTARHMHLTDGFSIVALNHERLIGLISVYGKKLPLLETLNWYIDILQVHKEYRRNGVATYLIHRVCKRAKQQRIYHLRSWSSEDKVEAIPMWKAPGFGPCPARTYPQGKEVHGYFVAKVL